MGIIILQKWFKLDVIRFTDYGVIVEKPRVGHYSGIFPCTLYHHAKFGKDRTTRAGTYTKIFQHVVHSANSKVQTSCGYSKKWLGTNNIVRTKSHTGSKFSKITLWQLYTRGTAVVHPYYSFSLRRQMAPQQNAQFITVFLVNIAAFSFSIMHRFGRSF